MVVVVVVVAALVAVLVAVVVVVSAAVVVRVNVVESEDSDSISPLSSPCFKKAARVYSTFLSSVALSPWCEKTLNR